MPLPRRPEPEPFHHPIGISPETFSFSRRWLALGTLVAMVLGAAALIALRLRGVL